MEKEMARCRSLLLCAVIVLSLLLCGVNAASISPLTLKPLDPDYQYPLLYRDQVYTNLSDVAREMFYAVNIHPSCVEKKGQCIPRGRCIERDMLYISRICYTMDRVCCYSNDIKSPTVEHVTKHPPATLKPSTDSP
ncbi:hypothetical protein HF086_002836 [Spodoptera exigua]|uniref:Uncharacterized protein n=1 Tax=Spodoptera exigua TaxID=7107 RepID=A0A922MPF8_SPOEX|nr:hypothetical protein HF086_002836 [Spodoptera exigua]